MGKTHNKKGEAINEEAIDLVNVDISTEDYTRRNELEHFGIILPEAGILKIETSGGSIGSFPLPAGYNPIACVKVFTDPGNTVTTFVAYY